MPVETLHFENARLAQQLYDNDTRNLKVLEEELGVKAVARDGWIRLEGGSDAIKIAKQFFHQLEVQLKSGSPLRKRDFRHALEVLKEQGVEVLEGLLSERIWTSDKKPCVVPKTLGQKRYVEAIKTHDVTFGVGPAGTGKTYLAVAMALSSLKEGKVSRIILTRPAVEAGEALGFLPGDLYEKILPYLRPLYDALHDMLPAEEIQRHTDRGVIEVAPLAYMRGRTLNNAFIILDEAQNATTDQMLMFLTRLGHGSKAVITGDETQVDLPPTKRSGLIEAHRILKGIPGIAIVELGKKDIFRHPLVERIVEAYEQHRARMRSAEHKSEE